MLFLRNFQSELLLLASLVFGAWNLLESKAWKSEFIARQQLGFEFGKFLKSGEIREMAAQGDPRPILNMSGKSSLIYAVGVADCGQALSELLALLPTLAGLPVEVSLLLIGATGAEAAQLYWELAPAVPNGTSFSVTQCEKCVGSDLGFRRTPYRILADLPRKLIFEEGIVLYRENMVSSLAESVARKVRAAAQQ
jgi:hypothetical protein